MHLFYSELPEKSYRYAATVRALMLVIKRKWQEFYLESSDSCRRKRNPYVVVVPFFSPYKEWVSRLKNFPFSENRSCSQRNVLSVTGNVFGSSALFFSPILYSSFLVLRCSNPGVIQKRPGAVLSYDIREVEWQDLRFCFYQQRTQVPWGGTHLSTLVKATFLWCQQWSQSCVLPSLNY